MAEVIGAIGFVLQTYSAIVELYKILGKLQGLEKDAPVLLWKLRMQQVRFEVFGRHWGLDKPGFNTFIKEEGLLDIIMTTLNSMKQMFEDGSRLDKIYGVQTPVDSASNAQAVSTTDAIGGSNKGAEAKKISMAGRFRWALRDKAKFEKLISDLREYNDSLHALLRLREASILENLTQSILLQGVTSSEVSRDVLQAAQESVITSAPSATHVARRPRQILYGQLQKSVEIKRHLLSQSGSAAQDATVVSRSMLLDQRSLQYAPLNSPSDVRLLAEMSLKDSDLLSASDQRTMQVVIDWRDTNVNSHVKSKVLDRLNKLTELLSSRVDKPDDLRVLECVGFFEDSRASRHGIVHKLPDGVESRAPTTLYDLMARQHDKVPDLNERFSLAQALTISILRLHDCGWLHTSFRSSNVVFFHQKHVSRSGQDQFTNAPWSNIDFGSPYLIGFSYAKPTSLEEITLEQSKSTLEHSLYRDPTLTPRAGASIQDLEQDRVRQQVQHDYYSLGIVLLEIGLWDQITTLWKTKYSRQDFLNKLLSSYVPKLGPKMGAVYRDTVVRLLTGSTSVRSQPAESTNSTKSELAPLPMIGDVASDSSEWSIVTELSKCYA